MLWCKQREWMPFPNKDKMTRWWEVENSIIQKWQMSVTGEKKRDTEQQYNAIRAQKRNGISCEREMNKSEKGEPRTCSCKCVHTNTRTQTTDGKRLANAVNEQTIEHIWKGVLANVAHSTWYTWWCVHRSVSPVPFIEITVVKMNTFVARITRNAMALVLSTYV